MTSSTAGLPLKNRRLTLKCMQNYVNGNDDDDDDDDDECDEVDRYKT